MSMKPLVSILIPAHNAGPWVADSIRSALQQTWPRTEIVVVDDGSRDNTAEIARSLASNKVKVVVKENEGAAATRNHAYKLCQGDFIQWLDADDLLTPNKIERQLGALRDVDERRTLLSSTWAHFYYRTRSPKFVHTALCQDLAPVEWLLKKMGENLHMQTATWLTSRELAEAAGPWNTQLLSDDDGEYFCRVLMASTRTRFVPDCGVLYRLTPSSRLSFVGTSVRKQDALFASNKLHLEYLLSLEDSDRTRKAGLTYLQKYYGSFYPERTDLLQALQDMATKLHGSLKKPQLRWKYAWLQPILGWKAAKWAQSFLPQIKSSAIRQYDKAMFRIQHES
jgi:glycosyltransferase involved in cell wall biosynthesis